MDSDNKDETYRRYILKKKLEVLKNKKGFHTALISLTIPQERKIHDVIGYLKNEISESSNIKSKTNRKNVLDSINALIGRLRNISEAPKNGLVMYSGQIPEDGKPGTEKSELYVIQPPEPITTFKYYCASEFLLEPLYDMINEKGAYGIINIENKEAAVGWVRGAHLEICKTFTSGIHSKHNAGGQSQRRLERLIEEGAQNFYKRVGEYSNTVFLEIPDLEGIFVSGAGMAKEKFVKKEVLDYRLSDKVLDFVDVSYSGEAGIRETVIKIQDKISNLRYIKEKKMFEKYMRSIVQDDGLATYGEKEVQKALEMGAVDLLMISEGLEKVRAYAVCTNCQYTDSITLKPSEIYDFAEKIRTTQCPKCNTNQFQYDHEEDFVEFLGELAEAQGTEVEMISTETEEGASLQSTFGGVAAILRFKIQN